MPATIVAGGKIVDIAGMPVGRRGYQRIGASAIVVDPGYDAVVTVLKAYISGIDLWGCCQRSIKKLAARLRAKETWITSGSGQEPECTCNWLNKVFDVLNAGLICPLDVVTQCRDDGSGVGVVVVDQNEEADE